MEKNNSIKMMKFRLNEAIARSQENGKKVFKKKLASMLFPGASEGAQQVNMTNLCNGTTKRIKPEWVTIITQECGCSADFLFGLTND